MKLNSGRDSHVQLYGFLVDDHDDNEDEEEDRENAFVEGDGDYEEE